jgi:predicted PurR-regulated permease PerM
MNDRTISITTSTIIKMVLILAGAWFLYQLSDLVIVLLTAIVIASGIEPAARWLGAHHIPRIPAVIGVYALFLGALMGIMYLFVPIFLGETAKFVASIPRYLEYVQYVPTEYAPILDVTNSSPDTVATRLLGDLQHLVTEYSRDSLTAVSTIFGGVVSFVLIIVFSFYFSIQERSVEDFLRVVTPVRHEDYVVNLWKRAQHKIGLWLQGQLLLGVIVGVLVYLGLTILGVPHALVLAVVAGFFEIIPVFGPTLSAIPAVMVGLADGGVTLGLLVVALYVIIQQFENHLIYPLVVTKVVGVPPLLVIIGLIIGAKLAGILGVLLSAPVAAVLQELIADADKERRRGTVQGT